MPSDAEECIEMVFPREAPCRNSLAEPHKTPAMAHPKTENSATADVTIAGPFDDGEADFDDHSGAGMGAARRRPWP